MFGRQKGKPAQKNESGVVAIIVVMVLVTILALISIGFSKLMNREVRQSLDRQLSAEAYFAAESGTNDARAYLSDPNRSVNSSPGCAPPTDTNISQSPFVANGDLSGDGLIRYSCLVFDTAPHELKFFLQPGESAVFKVHLADIAKLYLSWENQQYPSTGTPQPISNTFQSLPREDSTYPTDGTGVLRTGIYGVPPSSGPIASANAALTARSRNYIMYPDASNTAGTVGSVVYDINQSNVTDTGNGSFVHGNCNLANRTNANYLPYQKSTPRYCNSVITGLNGGGSGGTSQDYVVRLTAEYQPLSISVQAANNGGASEGLPNIEGVVDVTGTGNDVLNRIQSLVPLGNSYLLPNYGLQSMEAVCKAFRGQVTAIGQYGDVSNDPNIPNNDGACISPFNVGNIVSGGVGPITGAPCDPPYVGTQPNCTLPPPVIPPQQCAAGVTLYEHQDYQPDADFDYNVTFHDTSDNGTDNLTFAYYQGQYDSINDQADSISVPPGCVATVYSDAGWTGACRVFKPPFADGIGDPNFIGDHYTYYPDPSNPSPSLHDSVSSIRLTEDPHCE